ncbi:hypothetical protein LLG10_01820 [bacterium]|nr:hypothetical protein [bacterium]
MKNVKIIWILISVIFCCFVTIVGYQYGFHKGKKLASIPIVPMEDSYNIKFQTNSVIFMGNGLYYFDPFLPTDSLVRLDLKDKNDEPYNPYTLVGKQYTIKADGLYFKETENRKALIVGLDKDFVVLLSNSVLPKK